MLEASSGSRALYRRSWTVEGRFVSRSAESSGILDHFGIVNENISGISEQEWGEIERFRPLLGIWERASVIRQKLLPSMATVSNSNRIGGQISGIGYNLAWFRHI